MFRCGDHLALGSSPYCNTSTRTVDKDGDNFQSQRVGIEKSRDSELFRQNCQIGGRWLLSTLQSILVTDDDGNGLGVVGDSRPPKPHDGMWEVLASRVFVLGGGDQSRTRIEQDLPKAGCWAVLSAWVIMGISRFRMRAPALVVWSFRVA